MNIGPNTITVVVPCYNEQDVLPEFHRRLSSVKKRMSGECLEVIYVNDGSTDSTGSLLEALAEADKGVKVLDFPQNLGHQAAITAGLDFASGEAVVIIDADLQDPPELIEEIVNKLREGYDIVHTKRRLRKGESGFKKVTARLFYRIMNLSSGGALLENSGDFKGLTRPVLEVVRDFREPHRFLRGILSSVGFRQCVVVYDREPRYAGRSKYSLKRMVRLATNGILSFSAAPVRAISLFALLTWFVSLVYLLKALVEHFILKITVPGWTSIIILMTFFAGLVIFCLGIMSSYVGRIYEQGQARPLYWISQARNVDLDEIECCTREVTLSRRILRGAGH